MLPQIIESIRESSPLQDWLEVLVDQATQIHRPSNSVTKMRSPASGHSSGSTTGFSVWHRFKSFKLAMTRFYSRMIRRLPGRFVSPYSH
jgi:hypothetical protein